MRKGVVPRPKQTLLPANPGRCYGNCAASRGVAGMSSRPIRLRHGTRPRSRVRERRVAYFMRLRNKYRGFESLGHGEGSRNPASALSFLQQLEQVPPLFGVGGDDFRANRNLAKSAAGARFRRRPLDLDFQIRINELGVLSKSMNRRGVTAGQRGQQQILRRPPAIQATHFGRGGEVDRVRCGIGFHQSAGVRCPPSDHPISFCGSHCERFLWTRRRTTQSARSRR